MPVCDATAAGSARYAAGVAVLAPGHAAGARAEPVCVEDGIRRMSDRCAHEGCSGEPLHPEHPLCVRHAWATIRAIFKALTGTANQDKEGA